MQEVFDQQYHIISMDYLIWAIWVFPKIIRGTPKWMVYTGTPYQNGWFGGTTIFGNTYVALGHIVSNWMKEDILLSEVAAKWSWSQPSLYKSTVCHECLFCLVGWWTTWIDSSWTVVTILHCPWAIILEARGKRYDSSRACGVWVAPGAARLLSGLG